MCGAGGRTGLDPRWRALVDFMANWEGGGRYEGAETGERGRVRLDSVVVLTTDRSVISSRGTKKENGTSEKLRYRTTSQAVWNERQTIVRKISESRPIDLYGRHGIACIAALFWGRLLSSPAGRLSVPSG